MLVLEIIWQKQKDVVLRLIELGLLSEVTVAEIIPGSFTVEEEDREFYEFERLMRHSAYRRGRGGALRQVRWE